jgi:uncharacterized membrane protein YkgB
MENLTYLAQLALALSVFFVWTFRYHNVVKEFQQFGLTDITRNLVGATKLSLATLLVVGIWYPPVVLIASIMMGLFMVVAQYFHFSINNKFIKHVPSLILLLLCVFITVTSFYS